MDTIDRRVFLIRDVTYAQMISTISYEAFPEKYRNFNLEKTIKYYEGIINGKRYGIDTRIYGINSVYPNLIGFAHYSLDRCSKYMSELDYIAVCKKYQRMGVGGLLLNDSISDLVLNTGITVVRAKSVNSRPALAMYRSSGFRLLDGSPIDIWDSKDKYGDEEPDGLVRLVKLIK